MSSIQRGVKLLRLGVTTENARIRCAAELFGGPAQGSRRVTAEIAAATQLWGVDLDFFCCHISRLTPAQSTPMHYLPHLNQGSRGSDQSGNSSLAAASVCIHALPRTPCQPCLPWRSNRYVAAARVRPGPWQAVPRTDAPRRSRQTCRRAAQYLDVTLIRATAARVHGMAPESLVEYLLEQMLADRIDAKHLTATE